MRLFRRDTPADPPADPPRAPRVQAADAGVSGEVRLSPGGAAELLNVSESGLLVEGKTRLSTGAKVLVTITGREAKRLNGRVVRCQVCAIHRDGTMTYQTALALEQPAGLEEIAVESPAAEPRAVAERPAVAEELTVAEDPVAPEPPPLEEHIAAVEPPAEILMEPPPEVVVAASAAPRLANQW